MCGDGHPGTTVRDETVGVESEARECPWAGRFDDDVGCRYQLAEFPALDVVAGVEHHRLVPAVQEAVEVGVAEACAVRPRRGLDLDHSGAREAEDVCAQRTGPQ